MCQIVKDICCMKKEYQYISIHNSEFKFFSTKMLVYGKIA